METPGVFGCPFCGRNTFRTELARNQHIDRSSCAVLRNKEELHELRAQQAEEQQYNAPDDDDDNAPMFMDERPMFMGRPPPRPILNMMEFQGLQEEDLDVVKRRINALWDETELNEGDSSEDDDSDDGIAPEFDDNIPESDLDSNASQRAGRKGRIAKDYEEDSDCEVVYGYSGDEGSADEAEDEELEFDDTVQEAKRAKGSD